MGLIIFLSGFLFYAYSAVPIIFFEDNPEFITTAYTLGISHPSGYPLINMLGNLAGLLPFGSFAYRCNLLSSFFGALAVFFFYLCALTLTKDKKLSTASAFILMFSGSIWTQAAIMEIYTLHYALFFAILWIALSGRLTDFRWLLLSSFLFGLAVTNHLSFALSLIPFVLLWTAWKNEWRYTMDLKRWGYLLGAGIMSWGIQLYLPARSFSDSKNILFSWGRVDTLSSFLGNITGASYIGMPFNIGTTAERVNIFTKYLTGAPLWLWLIMTILFLYGIWKMWRLGTLEFLAFLTGIPLLAGYTLVQHAAIDILLVIPWGLILLTIFFGLSDLLERAKYGAGALILAAPLVLLVLNFPQNDRHEDYTAYDYVVDVFDTIPAKGSLRLLPGFQENYLFYYGVYGPAASWPAIEKRNGIEYYPYISTAKKTMYTHGLLYTSLEGSGREESKELVWEQIRSLRLNQSYRFFKGGYLTRDAFKGAVLSRIVFQRGLFLEEKGRAGEADFFFDLAAKFNRSGVMREAIIRHSWGQTDFSIKLLKIIMKTNPSARASALLARLNIYKNTEKEERTNNKR